MTTVYEGRYRVRRTPTAATEAEKLFPRAKHREELRLHALKLRWFPGGPPGEMLVGDLDCDKVQAVEGVYELRIDQIGSVRTLRLIFCIGDALPGSPLKVIWILSVFAKQAQKFRRLDLERFRTMRRQVVERYYAGT